MNFLFAVLTCNRMHYLKNCVKSLKEFIDIPHKNIMILDNCSVENGIDEYLEQMKSEGILVKRFADRVPNELYRAMNYAIKYCRKNKIEFVNFVQDDYQYMFKRKELLNEIQEMFRKHSKIGQIHTNLIWKRKFSRWLGASPKSYKVVTAGKANYAIFDPKLVRLCDNGFTRVSVYNKTGLYPTKTVSYDQNYAKTKGFGKNRYKKNLNGEMWFQTKCKNLGIRRAMSFYPNLAMMFSCAYVRGNMRFGKYFPPPSEYFLAPFNEGDIKLMSRRSRKRIFAFIENCVKADKWKPLGYGKHDIYSGVEAKIC